MTEPFINEDGELVEMDNDGLAKACLELSTIRSIGRYFSAAMDAMMILQDTLKELKGEDLNSMMAGLKVAELNSELIKEARRWLKANESRP